MNPRFRRPLIKTVLAALILLTVSTLVSLTDAPPLSLDLASRGPQNSDFACKMGEFGGKSLGEYFEVRQALHFHQVIEKALKAKPQARKRLLESGRALNALNEELLASSGQSLSSSKWIKTLVDAYPGAEKFRVGTASNPRYDVQGLYNFLEADVHGFFHKLFQENLLPSNYWLVRASSQDTRIVSLGVRLGEKTWARVGLFPDSWHLHIFKNPTAKDAVSPSEHFPLQAFSLRLWNADKMDLLDASGVTRLLSQSTEQLEITPFCEWLAGDGRSEKQLTQSVLKNL